MRAALKHPNTHNRKLQRLREAIAGGEEREAAPWAPDLIDEILPK
jgi:hypothetical protein